MANLIGKISDKMNHLVRLDTFLGKKNVIVGDKYSDLVLETLGKVYIKYGKNTTLLNDLFTLVSNTNPNLAEISVVTTQSEQDLWLTENYTKDGLFLYNSRDNILYITIGGKLIPLVDASEFKNPLYVKKSGDVMTGQLEMTTYNPPFIIRSALLIENLNSQYINGYTSDELAKKAINEYISGSWTFGNRCYANLIWLFKNNVQFDRDLIIKGSLGTSHFASGFAGYGWRLDANTNTLTIDNLIVRKAMQVYEMVVNKISATNGSLWISDAVKCKNAFKINRITDIASLLIGTETEPASVALADDCYYIFDEMGLIAKYAEPSEIASATLIPDEGKTFIRPLYIIRINNAYKLKNILGSLGKTLLDLADVSLYEEYLTDVAKLITIDWDKLSIDSLLPIMTYTKDGEFIRADINLYYKFFGCPESTSNYWVIQTDNGEYPLFRVGDIIRCLKMLDNNIKYYDAIVVNEVGIRTYLILKALGVYDTYTEISYNEDGTIASFKEEYENTKAYDLISYDVSTDTYTSTTSDKLGEISAEDDLVRVGNLQNESRQSAIYLTASDDYNPYIDFIAEVNRPDYSVLYNEITLKKVKACIKNTGYQYVKGMFADYYCLKEQCNAQNNAKQSSISNPIIYIKDDVVYIAYYDSDGNYINEITEDILSDNAGYYLTESPSRYSEPEYNDLGEIVYTYNTRTKMRVGLLSGIYNATFGDRQPYGYGLYGENVFLTGDFYLNNGKSVVDVSQEGVLLQYEKAGIQIVDNPDKPGDTMIKLDADKIAFDTNDDGKLELFIEDGVVNADLIRFNELNGIGTKVTYVYTHTITLDSTPYTIIGYDATDSRNEVSSDYAVLGTFFIKDSSENVYKVTYDFYDSDGDGISEYGPQITEYTEETITEFNVPSVLIYLDKVWGESNISTEMSDEKVEEYTKISINRKKQGETIIYWPDGTVMNAKIFWTANDNVVVGCVEYFFRAGLPESDLDKGDEYLSESKLLIKRINYFEDLGLITLVKVPCTQINIEQDAIFGNTTYSDLLSLVSSIHLNGSTSPDKYVELAKTLYGMYNGNSKLYRPQHTSGSSTINLYDYQLTKVNTATLTDYYYIGDYTIVFNKAISDTVKIYLNNFNSYLWPAESVVIHDKNGLSSALYDESNFSITISFIGTDRKVEGIFTFTVIEDNYGGITEII